MSLTEQKEHQKTDHRNRKGISKEEKSGLRRVGDGWERETGRLEEERREEGRCPRLGERLGSRWLLSLPPQSEPEA